MANAEDRGEHPNGRKAIDEMVRRQVEHGADPKAAKQRAIESALRHDRRNPR